jgi:hypothetical protein
MRFSFVFGLIALSAEALACPSLAGYYSMCRSTTGQQSGLEDLTITQTFQHNVPLYRMNAINLETQERVEESILADGRTYHQEHRDTSTGLNVLTQIASSCRQNVLVVNKTMIMNRQVVSQFVAHISKTGNRLRWANSGQVMGRPVADTFICE